MVPAFFLWLPPGFQYSANISAVPAVYIFALFPGLSFLAEPFRCHFAEFLELITASPPHSEWHRIHSQHGNAGQENLPGGYDSSIAYCLLVQAPNSSNSYQTPPI